MYLELHTSASSLAMTRILSSVILSVIDAILAYVRAGQVPGIRSSSPRIDWQEASGVQEATKVQSIKEAKDA
ncbi:hypothetical protein BGAL_0678g00030 [Botrytis galanthina]|uniref:Uncharacterized protein n=1 Tax=Botrytis galanthina TaxID=278940 RepID=A0A4S8QS56_9HELO|nr:hypothetical protein BGAL_0678g00030 [Botrytis galanthina]